MPSFAYHRVDVFTDQLFGGNQLAVFPDAAGIDPAWMQRIAREFNLSETTFVLPPRDSSHDVQVRIFTPASELPAAGHPTVGTAFVLAKLGRAPLNGTVRFLEGVGVIPVDIDQQPDGRIMATMTQPTPVFGDILHQRDQIAAMLSLSPDDLIDGLPVQAVSVGVPFTFVPVRSLEAMGRLRLRQDVWEKTLKDTAYPKIFMFTTETVSPNVHVHSRMFAPSLGIAEDAATGIASGPLGAYLVRYGVAQPGIILSEQGVEMGRPSLVTIGIEMQGDQFSKVTVGGYSVSVGTGQIDLPDTPPAA